MYAVHPIFNCAGAQDLSLRPKFSENKITYLFILSRNFCQSLTLYMVYSKKTQRNFVAYV